MLLRRSLLSVLVAAAVHGQEVVFLDSTDDLGQGAAYDSHRGRLVLFGADGETWEVDGSRRLHRGGAGFGPSPRLRPTAEFDPVRGHTLLFGGSPVTTTVPYLADTWTWDGTLWQQLPGAGPVARSASAMAFDTVRGRMVLFGGISASGQLNDTWEHDGVQWIQQSPTRVPANPYTPVMAFDSGRVVTVLGVVPSGTGPMATWEWDGVDWMQRAVGPNAPPGGDGTTMAFDPLRRRCVLLGGGTNLSLPFPGAPPVPNPGYEIWEWDGATWTRAAQLATALRRNGKAWFDAGRGVIVFAGGTERPGATQDRSTWTWNGSALTQQSAQERPSLREGLGWFGEPGGTAIAFGGDAGTVSGPQFDTWRWDGRAWTRLQPPLTPSQRAYPAVASNPIQQDALLFGGEFQSSALNDFWRWNGSTWIPLPFGPPARSRAGLALDPATGQAVLFGGAAGPVTQASALLGDTWLWNGVAWSSSPATGPSPRYGPALCTDLLRGVVVLFGGRSTNQPLNDTWEWNGVVWTQRFSPTTPPPLVGPSLAFDASRLSLALSGETFVGYVPTEHVWDFDGINWRQRLVVPDSFRFAIPGSVVADWSRGVLVKNNGQSVWEVTDRPADAVPYGTACGSPPPRLAMRARPRLGETSSGLELFASPGSPCVFAADVSAGNLPLGSGCTLWLGGIAVVGVVAADALGTARLPWSVPEASALRGTTLFAQAAALLPASPGGIALSAGLRFTIGD